MEGPIPPPSLGTTRVIVVDDQGEVRRTLAKALRRHGYDVLEAFGTEQALSLIASVGHVSLVMSDLHMPGRDGMELLREVRVRSPDTAFLMLTGDGDLETAVKSLQLGAYDYLTKPVDLQTMSARVAKALDERALRLEVRRLRDAYQTDLEHQVQVLAKRNQAMFLGQVRMAVTMLEAKDPYTRGHSHRVAQYAVATGRRMQLEAAVLEELRLGAELHDIGKIGTRDAVLHKPGALTDTEFAELRQHTLAGAEMLSVLDVDHPMVLDIVRSHHERVDGNGYPDGIRGDQIPLAARIVCVVDAYDAMTTQRPYRPVRDATAARDELLRGAGQQFDPAIVAAFCAVALDALED